MKILGTCILLTVVGGGVAQAQHHHHHDHDSDAEPAQTAEPIHAHAGLQLEVGKATALGASRNYQGVTLMLGATRGRFLLMAHVPAYRIEINDYVGRGLGDSHIMGSARILTIDNLALGLTAGVMPPYGDDVDLIGMGHWMVMGGGFARWQSGRVQADLSLSYGAALGAAGHAEHGVKIWPPVAPMNGRELRSVGSLGVDLGYAFSAAVSAMGAVPIGVGERLAFVSGELGYQVDRYRFAVGLGHGLAAHTVGLVMSSSVSASF